ncbi:MAG TPA: hypothetical protein DD417_18205 [Elusimicrobia bacterium]|nr:hypothetical protein [Elusimicrobiota bacterium]
MNRPQLFDLDGPLQPYLIYSAAAHGALVLALALILPHMGKAPEQVYRIDFIGNTSAIINRTRPEEAKPAAGPAEKPVPAKTAPLTEPDAFPLKGPKKPLPRPSFLPGAVETPAKTPTPAKPAAPEAAPGTSGKVAPGPAGPSAEVSADLADFPYPWYLAQLRSALWDRWSKRMPQETVELGILFTILADGSIVDLRIEYTSGDRGTDYAAMSAVKETAPLPPLPPGFRERFLRVHVQFRSQ